MIVRFLLVTVATLQVCWLGETWWWTVLTMALGVLVVGFLRPDEHDGEHAEEPDPTDHDRGAQQGEQEIGSHGVRGTA